MSAQHESEDDLDFINGLPSALETALNDSGSPGNNNIYKTSSPSSRDSSKSSISNINTIKHEEEGILHRPSISSLSDSSPIRPQGSRTRLLPQLQLSKFRHIKKWAARTAGFWRRNRGLCEVFLSQILSALVNTATRILETEDEPLPPFSLLFIRMAMTMILGNGYMWARNTPSWPLGERRDWGLLHLRGVLGFWAIAGFLYSLKYLPLSDATVLTFLAPSVTGYTSHLLLHSPFTRSQQVASFVALAGVLLIARPSSFFADGAAEARSHVAPPMDMFKFMFSSTNCNGTTSAIVAKSIAESTSSTQRLIAVGVALFGVLGSGGSYTIIRSLGTRTHPIISLNYFATYSTIFAGINLLFGALINSPELTFILPSSIRQWLMLLFIGVVGFMVQLLLTSGLAHEKSNRATDMIYTNMLWALVMDKVVFGSVPGWSSVVGSLLILGSAIFGFAAGGKGSSSSSTSIEERALMGSGGEMEEEEEEASEERILLEDMGV